jgi:hypothetical protein
MATASPDIKHDKFYKDPEAPLMWYFTQCSVAEQRDILVDIILPHAYKTLGMRHVRVLWIPKSGIPATQIFKRDILEVADGYQKAKIFAQNSGIVIEMAMAKSWLPLGLAWHADSLKIARMNLALDALCFHWLKCRNVDLTTLTMHDTEGRQERTVVRIQGMESQYLLASEYRRPKEGGHDLGWFGGRKGREIIRKVMIKYKLEPDFDKIRHSSDRHMRIEIPRVFWDGRKRDIPEPERGLIKPCDTFRERRRNARMYLAGTSSSKTLAETRLDKYLWYILNVQSTLPGRPADEMAAYTLSPSNNILQKTVVSRDLEQVVDNPQPREHRDGGRPAKRGRPGSYGQTLRVARKAEPNLEITFRNSSPARSSSATSRRPALERIEPPRKLDKPDEPPRKLDMTDSGSDSDYGGTGARKSSKTTRSKCSRTTAAANRSKSDEDEIMVLDSWDIPPLGGSPVTTSGSSSSDTEEDERAIQAIVSKIAAKVREEFLSDKKERKRRKRIEKEERKKKK